jgi:dihydrofolate reductase
MRNVKLIAISAVSLDGFIGVDNEIPWHISEDFKHFKETTMGNLLIVGYNTFLTLPPKALEGREYIVLNSDRPIVKIKEHIYQFRTTENIISILRDELICVDKVYVIGGAMIYDTFIDYCDEAIITWVNKKIPNGNKKFPIDKLFANFDATNDQDWQMSKSGIEYKIIYYKKRI